MTTRVPLDSNVVQTPGGPAWNPDAARYVGAAILGFALVSTVPGCSSYPPAHPSDEAFLRILAEHEQGLDRLVADLRKDPLRPTVLCCDGTNGTPTVKSTPEIVAPERRDRYLGLLRAAGVPCGDPAYAGEGCVYPTAADPFQVSLTFSVRAMLNAGNTKSLLFTEGTPEPLVSTLDRAREDPKQPWSPAGCAYRRIRDNWYIQYCRW